MEKLLQYSWTGEDGDWTTPEFTGAEVEIPLTSANPKVFIKASGVHNNTFNNCTFYFKGDGSIKVGGDILTLLNLNVGEQMDEGAFCCLFSFREMSGKTAPITDASDLLLPDYMTNYCCQEMFNGCNNLKIPPELPATILANSCYVNMFQGCTSLETLPELPATTLAKNCYQNMFSGCTSLETLPANLLPANNLCDSCYANMFNGCSRLTNVPKLSSMNLADQCYHKMFYGCTSLVTVSEDLLPATNLCEKCYNGMFQGCSSLIKAPDLPAENVGVNCYTNMFTGTVIRKIKVGFKEAIDDKPFDTETFDYGLWLPALSDGVQGTIYCPKELIENADASGDREDYLRLQGEWELVEYVPPINPKPTPNRRNESELGGLDPNFRAYFLKNLTKDKSKKDNTNVSVIDRDTFKSEEPAKTVIVADSIGSASFFDMKVHKPDEKTNVNQQFLVKNLVGPNASIILTKNIYPRRDLSMTEEGKLQTLTWNNLPKGQAGPVYAVVYSQKDGAYLLTGVLDANGSAVFNGFKLRDASTVTLCR